MMHATEATKIALEGLAIKQRAEDDYLDKLMLRIEADVKKASVAGVFVTFYENRDYSLKSIWDKAIDILRSSGYRVEKTPAEIRITWPNTSI